ncbi:hypothetical protein [Limimaricola hongkongensis]|uniref:Uncharacterized protein n=1 Tax=Limimaricola hongkongensis DSM 17492 TaxID=1122180 RepID=A0A017HB86_9RHOB|nr:hypothetical protein [Limimaricola hongkongensis]EYD71777.1 hypothetical protein Lokhon_01847 [Limimaricola hongkongensis DSM 17492]
MLDIHDDFARFMDRISPMPRKRCHEAILAEIREQANAASIERAGGDVVIRLHGLIGRGRDEAAAVGDWFCSAKVARRKQAERRAA